ncbi:MAG: HD-GYP domain-containing protein, partial [bacterium]
RSVYVLNNQSIDLDMTGHIISEKLRASAPFVLKDTYNQLLSKNQIDVSNGKKKLRALAASLIESVDFKMKHPPNILDLKRQDDYLYQHAINVAAYAILIGQSIGYHQMKLFDLTLSALLYDFGMMFIDDDILNKATHLDAKEFEKVKQHTVLGFQHLGRNCFLKGLITVVALQHHERFDGSGYPQNMAGTDIHEYSRIVALADFFDAYTSDRPYRGLHSIVEAVDYIKEQDGKEFDPRIVKHFLSYFE